MPSDLFGLNTHYPSKMAMLCQQVIVIFSADSGDKPRRVLHSLVTQKSNKGFSLLELLIVLFILLLGTGAIGLKIGSGNDATEHQSVARDLVSALRFAKGQALISREETTVNIDLNENSYTVSKRDKVFTIPDTIALTVVTAQEEMAGEGLANIRFFPDGSSSGGRVKLERNSVNWQIDINWLTGQVELEKK